MKRIFAFFLLCFLVGPTHCSLNVSPNLRAQACDWAQHVAALQKDEIQLMANVLYWGSEVSRADLLMRKLMGPFFLMTKKMSEAALTTEKQPHSCAEAAKRIAVFIKTSENYRIINKTWEACSNFVDNTPQSEGLTKLFEQFKNETQQQILTFLKINKLLVDELVKKNNKVLSLLGDELVIGTRIFSGLLQKIQKNTDDTKPLEKIDILSNSADFVLKQSHAGLEASLRAYRAAEIVEEISKTMLDLYYQELCNASEYECYIMFDQNGLLSKNQKSAFLPKQKNS